MTDKSKIFWRILLDLLMVFAVLQGWWFAILPLGLIGTLAFAFYIEILFVGIAYDALYSISSVGGFTNYLGRVLALVILLIPLALKRIVR